MFEASKNLASPSQQSENSASKRLHARDLYHDNSDRKYASPGSDVRYDRIKDSENEISSHIERASQFQNERLAEELKNNAYYKRELAALRSNLSDTRKVKSNHFPQDDEDYLLKSTKERIRRLQEERERELGYEFEENSAEKEKVRVRQSYREEELYKNLYPKDEEPQESNRLRESARSNKTYELSQSIKSPSAEYKERITGGLRALEDKMDIMEKELDRHLIKNNSEYLTNRELIEKKQQFREKELLKEKELNEEGTATEEDEEEQRMRSMKEKENRSSGKKNREAFRNAFSKREEILKQENQEREISRRAQNEEEQEASPEEEEEDREEIDDEEEAKIREDHKKRMFEEEVESLKDENRRIRRELNDLKQTQDLERRYGEPQLHAADAFPYDEYERSGKLKKTTTLRGSKKLNSDKAYGGLKYEDKIKQTINAARTNVHEKMRTNKTQGSKSLNKKKPMSDFEKEPQFLGLRNELYQKYYGYPTHLKEATILLNKGIPTSYMSDSRPEAYGKDPKKTLPKRYEKTLRR